MPDPFDSSPNERDRARVALVTGASSGIGEAFARSLAERGYDLLLAARREDRLVALAEELESRHGIVAMPVVCDLASPEGRKRCRDAVDSAEAGVDVAVLNAGFGSRGPAWTLIRQREVEMVELNCVAVADLAFHVLPGMVERGRGDLVVISSAASGSPMPYMATYAATKAFEARLVEAVAEELRRTGVRAIVVLPGPTRTEFSTASGSRRMPRFVPLDEPADVVEATWNALERGRTRVSTGLVARATAAAVGLLPRRLVVRVLGLAGRPPH